VRIESSALSGIPKWRDELLDISLNGAQRAKIARDTKPDDAWGFAGWEDPNPCGLKQEGMVALDDLL